MQLKTYRGADLAGALTEARRELGPDALVLATNEIHGRFGLTRVEITVAADRRDAAGSEEIKRLGREVERLRRQVESAPQAAPAPSPERFDPRLETAIGTLVRSGLDEDLARRFARIASTSLAGRTDAGRLSTAAGRAMRELLTFGKTPLRSGVLFVIGPPGAGKTTTVAKLAGRIANESSRQVILAQGDPDRIGAMEQTELLAARLGAEPVPVRDAAGLEQLRRRAGRRRAIVVDTPGVGAEDPARLDRVCDLRRAAPRAETALLIPAGLHRDEARRVLQRFEPVRPTCVGFSRVDDSCRTGELVTAIAPTELPLAFVTTGHRIPDDLVDASPRGLAALLLRSGFRSDPTQENRR